MGAGTFPAGAGPAGYSPVTAHAPVVEIRAVRAALYDPSVHDYPLDANGRVIAVHPVDQAVALALGVERGAVASVPTLGSTLRTLPRGNAGKVRVAARTSVEEALSALITRGDVTLLSVNVELPRPGLVTVDILYRNERTRTQRTRTVIVS